MTVGPFGFPAEDLLTEPPPDYPRERIIVMIKLIAVFVFFIVILPVMMTKPVEVKKTEQPKESKPTTTNGKTKGKQSKQKQRQQIATSTNNPKEDDEEVIYAVNPSGSFISVLGCLIVMPLVLILHSPDNYYTPNGVFQAPLLTKAECQEILKMADDAAEVNYQEAKSVQDMYDLTGGETNHTIKELLEEPRGWNKYRHQTYPTTDLNLITDPFTKDDREYIKQKMDARLSPIIQRIYGIPPSAIRAIDVSCPLRKEFVYNCGHLRATSSDVCRSLR